MTGQSPYLCMGDTMTIWTLRIVIMACAMSLGGCGAQGLIGPILSSGVLGGGSNTTLTLQIDQAHGVLVVGAPAAPIVAAPTPSPVPVVVVPSPAPPGTPPVVVTPVPAPPSSPPANLPLRSRHGTGGWPSFEQLAAESHQDFWGEHRPSFRLVAVPSGISAEPLK